MKKPIIHILLFYTGGIIYGRYLPLYLSYLATFIILALSVSLIFLIITRRSNLSILITAISLLAGAAAINYQSIILPDNNISHLIDLPISSLSSQGAERGGKVTIEGTLYKPPEVIENRTRLYINAERIFNRDTSGKVRITLYRNITDADYKDRVRIKNVRLYIPRNFKNPGGFDYNKHLEDEGIYAIGSIGKAEQVEIINRDKGGIFSYIYKSKEKMSFFVERNSPPEESSILKTMVFGEKTSISKDIRNIFSSTGIAHLLAVSGLHVGFVAFASFLIFRKLFSFLFLNFYYRLFLIGAVQRFAAFFTILPVLYYSLLVGASPSAIRATIMAIVYLLSIALYREGNIYNTLSLAALVILIWHPQSLFNIGFQLSFAAVLSIVYGASIFQIKGEGQIIESPFKEFFLKHRWLYNYIISSLFATAGTLPIIAYHFNLISIIGLIVNIFAIPLASLIVPLTLVFSMLSDISNPAASFLMGIPVFLTFILSWTAKFFTNIPYYSIRVQTPSLLTIFMIYPLLFGVLNINRHRLIKMGTISLCLFLVISFGFRILSHHSSLITHHSLRVTFLDVGQGECSLIQFPNGKTMLIDGGRLIGDFDIGGNVVAPYLWDIGITKVDYVIGSHSDSDHVGGLLFILNEMPVKNYLDNGEQSQDLILKNLREIARNRNIPYKTLRSGEKIEIDEKVKVEILHPPSISEFGIWNSELKPSIPQSAFHNPHLKGGHDNNLSIVLKITYDSFSVLFTGDIEKEVERFLIGQGINSISFLKSTILKAPHHGSNSSSIKEFIEEVSPEAAIFSVGYNNSFKHPSKKVLARYRDSGVRIYRTDRDGLIEIESDGKDYTIKTYEPTADSRY